MINPGEKNKKPVEWCREAELNRRPTDYESVALPTELPRHYTTNIVRSCIQWGAGLYWI